MRKTLFSILLIPALSLGLLAAAPHHVAKKTSTAVPVVRKPGIPAYHASPPRGPVPATLNPAQFTDPRVQAAYEMASKVEKVLYQEPCYCRCDLELGHTSLLDCYTGTHASICETCLMEGIFVYQQTKKGKTATQIRAEIEHGEWKNINLNNYILPRTY